VQSIEEVHQLLRFGIKSNISAAVSSATDAELNYYMQNHVVPNVFIPEELQYCLENCSEVGIRADFSPTQDQRTALKLSELPGMKDFLHRLGKFPKILHTYPGTDSDCDKLIDHAEEVMRSYAEHFGYVREINLGADLAMITMALQRKSDIFLGRSTSGLWRIF